MLLAGLVGGALTVAGCGVIDGEALPPADGATIEGAPGYPLFDHTLTWTGDDIMVVGGAGGDMNDGLLVDEPLVWNPTDGVRPISSPPGQPRNRHTAVWTGRELFVWSGTTQPYGVGDGLLSSTVAYDPNAGSWRPLADGPARAARVRGRGATFKNHVVVTGGTTPSTDDEGTIGLYNLDTDSWTTAQVPGDALTAVATDNAAYVLWVDGQQAIRLSHLDPDTRALTDVDLPGLPPGANQSNAVVAGDRLVIWAEAAPEAPDQPENAVTVLVLDDDRALAADPGRPPAWRVLPVEVEFPGSASGFSDVRPLVHTDNWLAFMEGAAVKWIRIDDGLEVQQSLTLSQSCALNTEAVGTPDFVVAWGGNCTLVNDDGSEEQIVDHVVFAEPEVAG